MMENKPPLIEDMVNANIQIQENGVDLTIGSLYRFYRRGVIDFDNSHRQISRRDYISTIDDDIFNEKENRYYQCYNLKPGVYAVVIKQRVNLPKDVIALTISRSSLTRSGVYIQFAVWDAGYSGYGEVLLHVVNQYGIKLMENARICQMIFMKTDEESDGYKGEYQYERI